VTGNLVISLNTIIIGPAPAMQAPTIKLVGSSGATCVFGSQGYLGNVTASDTAITIRDLSIDVSGAADVRRSRADRRAFRQLRGRGDIRHRAVFARARPDRDRAGVRRHVPLRVTDDGLRFSLYKDGKARAEPSGGSLDGGT
jgi:hypothetical protein